MRILVRPALAPAFLALVAGASSPTGTPARTSVPAAGVEVPMRRIQGLPAVDVSINGSAPRRFVVDWGANLFAVSPRVAEELKLPRAGTGTDRMGNKNVRVDTLAIGGARFEGLTAAVDPFLAGRQEQGVLGVNVYGDALLTLDYPRGLVRVEAGRLPAADGRRVLSCRLEDGPEPAIEISLAGKPVVVMLDTGAARLVMLPAAMAAQLPLRAPPAPIEAATGPQGASSRTQARLRGDLRLGTFVIHDPTLTFHSRPRAFLGGALLQSFAVTLDAKGQKVRFERPSGAPLSDPSAP